MNLETVCFILLENREDNDREKTLQHIDHKKSVIVPTIKSVRVNKNNRWYVSGSKALEKVLIGLFSFKTSYKEVLK